MDDCHLEGDYKRQQIGAMYLDTKQNYEIWLYRVEHCKRGELDLGIARFGTENWFPLWKPHSRIRSLKKGSLKEQ